MKLNNEVTLANCARCGKEVVLNVDVMERRKKVYCTLECMAIAEKK